MSGRCIVIGLMGGIGSGKSTVADIFAAMGAAVLDADAMCAELHRTAEVKQAVRDRWGDDVFGPDGELDSARVADIVFGRPEDLAALNGILHPKVIERTKERVAACREEGGGMCVIDAPLLLERGLIDLCDATVFVECDAAVRAARLAESRGWTPEEIARREARQAPLARKQEMADHVVGNDGDVAATRQNVQEIVAHLNPFGEE